MKQSFSILDTVPWVRLGAIGLTLVVVTLLTPQTRVYAQSSPTHTIEPGETLSQIAESYGISLIELMELNSITDPDAIVSGQILVLPAPSDAAPAPAIAVDEAYVPDTPPTEHLILPGESLSRIAEQYGLTMDELMELNSITDPDAIVSGQILVLPAPSDAAPAPAIAVDEAYVPDTPPTEHHILPGESLSRIAEQYGLTMDELMEINGISDPDTIVIGQKLRLTPVISTEAAQVDAPAPPLTNSGNPIASLNQTYTVGAGDSIAYIALRFGIEESALRWLNNLESSTLLERGQELILPATAKELAFAPPMTPVGNAGDAVVAASDDRLRHTVEEGDSLGRIAQEHGLTLAALMEANQIVNPDAIYIGQQLIIPSPMPPSEDGSGAEENKKESEEDAAPKPIGRPRSGFFYYTVKPGDTLSELAREFDSTQLALLEYNDLPDTETVYLGLELRIPYGPPPLPVDAPPIPLSGTRFIVSLSRQQCWVLEGENVRYAWQCSTGYGEWITRTGNFAVQTKQEMAKSTAYELDMPYWLGIYDVGTYENGIHGLPLRWETGEKIWDGLIGQPATFGCAMLDDEDAETLFNLAFLGMPIHIVP